MTMPVKAPKKLIEVALPLDIINEAAVREKSIHHGHPSTLHLWWARRPLAVARAVIFGQLVNDPSWKWEMEHFGEVPPNNLKASWQASRKRLFAIIEKLVKWENTTNEDVLEDARKEIVKSWRETCELNKYHPQAKELFNTNKLPGLHDPFAGGGTIPLEAQRLGLETYASDLNPVAVLINKAMIEIPPKFAGLAPVGPLVIGEEAGGRLKLEQPGWTGVSGLAEDVRRYGKWMRDEAEKRIGHLYPKIEVTKDMAKERPDLKPLIGQKLTVVAWLWVRTVKSPNPAFRHVDVPLASTFILSTKRGKEAYVEPIIDGHNYVFNVKLGNPPTKAKNGTKLARGANFRCLVSNTPIEGDFIKSEGAAGRMGAKLMALVVGGSRGRIYLSPSEEMENSANSAVPTWKPEMLLPGDMRAFWTPPYGVTHYHHLFSPRQLVALTTFSDLIKEVLNKAQEDAVRAGMRNDNKGIDSGGTGAKAYAEAIAIFLGFAISKLADRGSSFCGWDSSRDSIRNTFGRQGIPMVWDYAESNFLSGSTGSIDNATDQVAKVLEACFVAASSGNSIQLDAMKQTLSQGKFISTDPPYYDNIGYADLSDFFYVWLRRSLKPILPVLFSTIAVPKEEELIATPYRHGSKEKAEKFFLNGMTYAMGNIARQAHPAAPVTIYYAFKQSETESETGTISTGWETFLEAVIKAGFALTGTWPMRTELVNRMISSKTNALASSIVMVCRPRSADAPTISRRQFLRELDQVLLEARDAMTKAAGEGVSPVAPVDLSQAIIGPGMAVFSKYSAVLEADGTPMGVGTALRIINGYFVDPELDPDTQFCLHWFEQYGWREGSFGQAEVLARSKGTSVVGIRESGILFAEAGVVRLLRQQEYDTNWNPEVDSRLPVWEVLHRMVHALQNKGYSAAGEILAFNEVLPMAEGIRLLAYRLYTLCERARWAEDARGYNELVTSWSSIESTIKETVVKQGKLFDE